jgi:hypothetical protein
MPFPNADEEDDLAVHTLVMAAYGILEDLAKGNFFYEAGLKPHQDAVAWRGGVFEAR